MNKLIIAEKPSVALRIALSLTDAKPRRNSFNGIGYYEIQNGQDTLFIVAAAGHLFSLHQRGEQTTLPIFDIEWVPSYKYNKKAYFTKKYLDTIEEVGKKCSFFINACDYDLEGTVIGSNLIKLIINKNANSEIKSPNVMRMKFSTTTKIDLLEAYKELNIFDFNNMHAGETRHMLDWMWGINLSRALMLSLSKSGIKRILSIGRVQGPALSILAQRDIEIKNFVPKPYWKLFVSYGETEFENKRGSIFEKAVAEEALERTKSGKITVSEFTVKEEVRSPFPPFDLTSLQIEASRVFRIDPSKTLAIAQRLYESSYISYPRTSSQKLPPTLNLKRIITDLSKIPEYSKLASHLIGHSRYRPHEGLKDDDAHPSIHPTGEEPKKLADEESKIYNLITKRFLSCFAEYAKIQRKEITLSVNGEEYFVRGETVKEQGWLEFYKEYYKYREASLPDLEKGSTVEIEKAFMKEEMTAPPKRYTKASLINLLEKKNLGTKATRAAIIDTLFNREYIKNSSMEVTEFGMSVYNALSKCSKEILDEDLTKKLESDMEKIAHGELAEESVISEGKQIITTIIKEFEESYKVIGSELSKALAESAKANILGKCKKCSGDLVIKRTRNRKVFVGCTNWPKCDAAYPLPQYAKIVPLHKVCELCNTPKVKVFMRGKVFEMDLDPNCETKKNWKQKAEKASEVQAAPVKTAAAMKLQTEKEGHTKKKAKVKEKVKADRKTGKKSKGKVI